MGNICKTYIQQIETEEVNLHRQNKIDEQNKFIQELVTEDQKVQQDKKEEQKPRTENNYELKRREKKKVAQIAAVIDQEVIYENTHKPEIYKVLSNTDWNLNEIKVNQSNISIINIILSEVYSQTVLLYYQRLRIGKFLIFY